MHIPTMGLYTIPPGQILVNPTEGGIGNIPIKLNNVATIREQVVQKLTTKPQHMSHFTI